MEYLASGSTVSFQMRTSSANRAQLAGLPSHVGIMLQAPPPSIVARALREERIVELRYH